MSKKVKAALLFATMTGSCMIVAHSDAPTHPVVKPAKAVIPSAQAESTAAGETASSKQPVTIVPAAIAAGVVSVVRSENRVGN